MKYFPHFLAIVFLVVFIAFGISPKDRTVWIAEITPVVLVFIFLLVTYKKFIFSNLAYFFMSFWLIMHTIGGHYTFANVPFSFITDLFGFERNHFDRIAHFSIGFYAYPMAEFLFRKNYMSKNLAMTFGLLFIMSVAGAYEVIEWIYAEIEGGDAGIEFLGSQGDIWDAQKDILCDTLGAIFSLIVFNFIAKKQS